MKMNERIGFGSNPEKSEKVEKSEKAVRIWLIIAVCVAIVGIVSTAVLAVGFNERENRSKRTVGLYSTALENQYRSSLYGLADAVKNVEVNLGKAAVSSSAETQRTLLLKLAMEGEAAESYASLLPFYKEDISAAIKFINQISDYSKTLLKKLGSGGFLSSEDRAALYEMKETVSVLKENLDKTVTGASDISLSDTIEGKSEFPINGDFSTGQEDETFEYPRLIYDGPFSDGRTEGKSKLAGKTFEPSALKAKIASLFSGCEIGNVRFVNSLNVKGMLVHSFSVSAEEGEFTVDTTAVGGYVVQLNGYAERETADEALDTAACLARAEEFCKKAGYDVKPVWVSKSVEGYVYVNLCPVTDDGIIIYPDLVKVTIDTVRSCVTGLEGYGYVVNHTERELSLPENRADRAGERLSDNLTIKKVSLALIPESDKEILCYEFECADGKDEYFVYINVKTLEEENVLRVIRGTEGYTVI